MDHGMGSKTSYQRQQARSTAVDAAVHSVTHPEPEARDNRAVGFNPFGQQRRRPSDYVFVVVALAVTFALVVWALLPR